MNIVIIATLVVLILIDLPIVFVFGLTSVAGVVASGELPLSVIPQRIFVGLDSFPLLAAPLFMLAGEIMSQGAMSDRLVKFATALFGHLRGSLAMICVIATTLFSCVSGSGAADTAAVGSILIPAMIKRGYNAGFATALQASAGCLGPIIPPSIAMVIYAWVAGVSVGALFLGGVIPGLLIATVLLVISYMHARNGGEAYEGGERASAGEMVRATIGALPALGMPVIIVGGFRIGAFTATEAAAIAVFYALAIELCVYRDLRLRDLPELFATSALRSTVVMFVVATAALLGWMVTFSGMPDRVADLLGAISPNAIMLLFWLNVLFLIMGTFMESYAAIILLVPLLLPLVKQYNIDLVHFGVIVTVNLCIGMITPPVGITLFVASSISNAPMGSVYRHLWPMLLGMIAVLMLITYVPQTILYLPSFLAR
jgi:C4-dicarboxylate transporter DctM subunit